jgi:hypothetical protein
MIEVAETGNPQRDNGVVRAEEAAMWGLYLGIWHGGIMRIRRALVVPAILAFSVAGSILGASAAAPLAAAHVSTAHVVAANDGSNIIYWA